MALKDSQVKMYDHSEVKFHSIVVFFRVFKKVNLRCIAGHAYYQ